MWVGSNCDSLRAGETHYLVESEYLMTWIAKYARIRRCDLNGQL